MDKKQCRACGEILLLAEFSRDKSRRDGYRESCKLCSGAPCSRCGQPMVSRKPGQACKPCRRELRDQEIAQLLAMGEKACAKCGLVKPLDQFNRDQSRRDGRHGHCRECVKRHSGISCSRCGDSLSRGSGRLEQPVCQPCRRELGRSGPWFCEQCGQEFRRYSSGNTKTGVPRFCSRKCFADFQRTGRSRIHARRRKAVVASTWDGVTDEQIWERDGWACMIPGCELGPIRRDLKWPERLSPTVDHIVPLSRGGTDIAPNKRAAHAFCNMSRHNRMHQDDVQIITPELAPLGLLPRWKPKPKTCPVHGVALPWPKLAYWRPCRWCGEVIRCARPSKSPWTVCAACWHGKCVNCGAHMAIVVNSRAPDKRLCQACQRGSQVLQSTGELLSVEPASAVVPVSLGRFWALQEQGKLKFAGTAS